MECIYICNTSSDYISKVNITRFNEENRITLNSPKTNKVGPHGICQYKDKLLVANSYSNSLSIIDIASEKEVDNYFIGMHCNDVAVCEDNAYIICGELNNVIIFNLLKNRITETIPCGNLPHSININKKLKLMIISNMEGDSISIIDCVNREKITTLKVAPYPTNAIFTQDGENIIVCESNIGTDLMGSICIINLKNLKNLGRILVGNSPVSVCTDENYGYVSNFGDGTISIIDIKKCSLMRKIRIGGMPRGILKLKNNLFVGDNYNNLLVNIDILTERKKAISIGKEPTAMTLFNHSEVIP